MCLGFFSGCWQAQANGGAGRIVAVGAKLMVEKGSEFRGNNHRNFVGAIEEQTTRSIALIV